MCYEDSYFRYFSFKLKNTQLLGSKVMRILAPNNVNFEDNIKEIIMNNQETSFIHIISRNLYTLKEDQLNIYKKVQLFILYFCEMKPEKVNWFSYVGKAREIECAMSAFDLDSLLRSLYYDETKFDYSRRNTDEKLHEKYENDKYCLPGGYVELNETTEDAIKRELLEETKLKFSIDKFCGVIENFFVNKLPFWSLL